MQMAIPGGRKILDSRRKEGGLNGHGVFKACKVSQGDRSRETPCVGASEEEGPEDGADHAGPGCEGSCSSKFTSCQPLATTQPFKGRLKITSSFSVSVHSPLYKELLEAEGPSSLLPRQQ